MNDQQSFSSATNGCLYLIPTPIGNLEDMTFRAIRLLQEADLILAEDTRNTLKLLNHFDIHTPMRSFHEHSSPDQVTRLVQSMQSGQTLALVSDAGMPLINDPGHPLVTQAIQSDIPVIALPGANAALTALIASGLSCVTFTYYGFFPREKKEQQHILMTVGTREETAIFYESPYRLKKSLAMIQQQLGDQVQVVVARELTKRYENYWRGTAAELVAYVETIDIKGECVLLIEGGTGEAVVESQAWEQWTISEHVDELMATEHLSSKEAIKQVAKLRNLKKQMVYQAYHINAK